jgi:hypothetical protein
MKLDHLKHLLILVGAMCGQVFSLNAAEERAVTESGKEVILREDGTWKVMERKLEGGKEELEKNTDRILLQGEKTNYGLWVPKDKWEKFVKCFPAQDLGIHLKNQELYAAVVSDKMPTNLEFLRQQVFLPNMLRIKATILEEKRTIIRGKIFLFAKFAVNMEGVPFIFHWYGYGGNEGTIQLSMWAHEIFYPNNVKEMEELVSGFVILN